MGSLLTILMLVILAACMATLYTEGMWGNAILFVNVVTAALVATNYFEPVARMLDGWQPSYTYVWDFLTLWGLFSLVMLILRTLTDQVSKVKVRFLKLADQIGGAVFALLIGWVMVCFTMMSLHTAPLAKNFLFGGFDSGQKMFLGLAPDQKWLGFMQMESKGALSCSQPNVFDPGGQFAAKYEKRRGEVETNITEHNTIRVGK